MKSRYKDGAQARFAHVGFGNYVARGRALPARKAQAAGNQRALREAKRLGRVIDLTAGRPTTAVIPLDNGQFVLTAMLARRLAAQGLIVDPELLSRQKRAV